MDGVNSFWQSAENKLVVVDKIKISLEKTGHQRNY
jgi:hypothetical protein